MKRLACLLLLAGSLGCSEKTKPNPAPSIFVAPAQIDFAAVDPELFQRLGRDVGLVRIVDIFADTVKGNDKVSEEFKKRLEGQEANETKKKLVAHFAALVVGKSPPAGGLGLAEGDFDPILIDLRTSTIASGVAPKDADEFVGHLEKVRAKVK